MRMRVFVQMAVDVEIPDWGNEDSARGRVSQFLEENLSWQPSPVVLGVQTQINDVVETSDPVLELL